MKPGRPTLVGMTLAELEVAVGPRQDARMRSKQLAHHLYRRFVAAWDAMADLPTTLRSELAERFDVQPLEVASRRTSTDGVDKLLVHNGDGNVYECV